MEIALNTIIIDDDVIATKMLSSEIDKYARLNLTGNASSGSQGRELIIASNPDLIFLDVELPDCTGFDFFRSVNGIFKETCNVVFYTAYDKYMINALREQAFDFLLKPIDSEEMAKVVSRVFETSRHVGTAKEEEKPLILNTASGDIVILKPNDISYFKYDGDVRCWIAFLTDGKSQYLRHTTRSDKILSFSIDYVMIDKSHIINLNKLTSIKDGCCILQAPYNEVEELYISKMRLAEIRNRFPNL